MHTESRGRLIGIAWRVVLLTFIGAVAYPAYTLAFRHEAPGQAHLILPGLAVASFGIIVLRWPGDFHAYLQRQAGKELQVDERYFRPFALTALLVGGLLLWQGIRAL